MVPSAASGAGSEKRKPGVSVAGSSMLRLLLPGDRLVVRFEDAVEYGHERLILWPVFGDGDYVVLTADGDVYSESESDWKEAILMTGLKSNSAGGMPPEPVLFELTIVDPEILSQIRLGRAEALALRREEAARVVAPAPSKAFMWRGEALKSFGVMWADERCALNTKQQQGRELLMRRSIWVVSISQIKVSRNPLKKLANGG